MKTKIETWLKKLMRDAYVDIPYKLETAVIHSLFAYVGIERLKKILEEMEKKGINYISLAEIYGITIRKNIEKENSDIIHNYYELLPKLDDYRKAFNWQIGESEKQNDK